MKVEIIGIWFPDRTRQPTSSLNRFRSPQLRRKFYPGAQIKDTHGTLATIGDVEAFRGYYMTDGLQNDRHMD